MRPSFRRSAAATIALLIACAAAPPAQSQQPRQNVISANPFGLLIELFNAEYERIVSASSTAGVGGSTFSQSDERYLNADVFWRFYPGETPLDGWAFGVKAGITSVTDVGTYPGFGFDVNRSWILGRNENFYVGIGFGLKRLFGAPDDELDVSFIPTIRIINVGFAF